MSKSLLKFRTRNHKLPIETGRWAGISLSKRKCKLCFNDVGDEYHYLLCCKHFCVERNRFIKPYYFKRANSIKYRDLMNTENKAQLNDLCKFIQIIISRFRKRKMDSHSSKCIITTSRIKPSISFRQGMVSGKYSHFV